MISNHLSWVGDVPELGEQNHQVHVTVLDDEPILEPKTRGRRIAEVLANLAATQVLGDIDPTVWQQETRQDRSLPGR